jgi:hypothetical protein
MKIKIYDKRQLILAFSIMLLIVSCISNYQISKAAERFVQYDNTTWEKSTKDITYTVDIYEKTKNKISFAVTVCNNDSGTDASIEVNNSKLSNGKSNFSYTDSWGNQGKGTIYVKNKTLYLKLKETKQDKNAMFSAGNLKKHKFTLISNNFS